MGGAVRSSVKRLKTSSLLATSRWAQRWWAGAWWSPAAAMGRGFLIGTAVG
uniref:Uncharacterized protein n=1 Tax=Arundo donax TaxID=35708 RepID=A0A0A9E844_ARUDO